MAIDLNDRIESALDYEKAREAPRSDFPPLPEIPGGRYTRQDFNDLEMTHVWRKSWVCIGREEGLEEPGSFRSFTKLGAPMIVVRGRDHKLRAFYNTCRHRGAPVVREEEGRTSLFRCQYHSWTYQLDGRLIGVPDERDFPCLNKAERGLIEVPCDAWAGWVFINEDPDAAPLTEHLGQIPAELDAVGMEKLRTVHYQSYILDCNWKAAVDAFLEVYHIKTIHPTNAAIMLDHEAAAMGLMKNGHSRMVTRKKLNTGANFCEFEGAPNIDGIPDIFRRNNTAYQIFPNVVTPIDTVGFPFLVFWPRGPHQCEMEAIYVAPSWEGDKRPAFWDAYLPIFDQVLDEDIKNLAPIQKSLNSKAFTGMMINYQERRIYWFHEEIDRRIGLCNVPQDLAVAQVLSEHMETPLTEAAE